MHRIVWNVDENDYVPEINEQIIEENENGKKKGILLYLFGCEVERDV